MKNRGVMKIFYKLFFLAAVFFSVFVLLQLGDNVWAVGIAGVVVLIAGYLYFAQCEKERQEEKERERIELNRRLDELLNAQRAIYTITKRGNARNGKEFTTAGEDAAAKEILEKILSAQERGLSENRKFAEIQVNALKTVAKYNKENTRQLALNIGKNVDRLSERLQSSTRELEQGIKGTTEAIEEAEEFYQNMSVNRTGMSEADKQQAVSAPEPEAFGEPYIREALEPEPLSEQGTSGKGISGLGSLFELGTSGEEASGSEPLSEQGESGEGASGSEPLSEQGESGEGASNSEPLSEQGESGEEISESERISEPEAIADLSAAAKEFPPSAADAPDRKQNLGGTASLFAPMGAENTPGTKNIFASEQTADPAPSGEPVSAPEDIPGAISIPEPDQIIIPDPEPIQAPPPMPVMDDPNKKMSEDEIAALIAALTPHE